MGLNALAPAGGAFTLEVYGYAAVVIKWLSAGPRKRLLHARADFNLCRELHLAAVALGQQKRGLANAPAVWMASIQSALQC